MKEHLKILLLGDYSKFHHTLSIGLKRLGCEVVVASDGGKWQQFGKDIDLTRRPGRLGGLWFFTKMLNLERELRGFDIVAINDTNFVHLAPPRLRILFDMIKKHNGRVFLSAISTDLPYLDMLEARDSPLRYSEWFVNGEPSRHHIVNHKEWDSWHSRSLIDYQNYVFDNLDGAVGGLYEYYLSISRRLDPDRVAYGGIPVDTKLVQPVSIPSHIDKVKIFLGRDKYRMIMKGTDYLEEAARRVVAQYPDRAELVLVENKPYDEFLTLMRDSHVVLDQIYSYTPATTALLAMSCGLNVMSGGEPEYYDFIGENDNRPIINAPLSVDDITAALENIVMHPAEIGPRGALSREFAIKHNDLDVVAKRNLDFWISKL